MASSSSRSSSNSVNREQDAPTAAAAASKTSISRRKNRVSEAFEVAAEKALASRFLVLQKLGPTTFLIQQDHEVPADDADDICTEAGEVVFHHSSASGTDSGEGGSASSSYDPRDHAKPQPDAAKANSGGGGSAAATRQKFKVSLGVPRHTCSCGGGTSKVKCATSSSDRTSWCVHICFVLLKVLRIGRDFATVSQDRITEAELEQLLSYQERQKQKRFVEQQKQQRREEMMSKFRANLENAGVGDLAAGAGGAGGGSSFSFKPPDADDQCPICFDDLLDEKTDKNSLSLVYCADGCRQAIHTACMYKWCEHHGRSGSADNATGATCPLCRVSWSKEQIVLLGKRYQRSIRKRKEAHAGFGCVFCKSKPIRGALFAALGAGGCSGGGGGSGVASAGSGFAGGRALLRHAGLGIVQGTGHATFSSISAHQPASDEASNMIATYCEDCFYNPVARAATSGKPFVKKAQADSSDLELVCLPVSTVPQVRQPQPVTVGGQNVHPPGSQHMAAQNASLVLLQEVVAANPEFQSMDDVPLSVMLALGHEVAQRRQTRGTSGVPPLQWQQVEGADSSTSFVSTTSTSTRTSSSSLSLPRTQTTVAPEPIVTTMDGAILHALAIEARDAQTTQRKSGTRIEVTGSRKKECVFCTSSSSTNAEPADVLLPRCGHWAHRSCVSGAYKCPACDTFLLRSLDALLRKKVKPDEQALAKGGGGSADLGAALLLPGSSDALCLHGSGVSLGGPTSTLAGAPTHEEQGDDSTSRTRIIPNRAGRRGGVNAGGTRATGPALAAPIGAAANLEVGNSAGTTATTEFAPGEEFSLEGASMRLRCDSHTAAAPPAASNTALQTTSSRSAGGGRSQKLASSGQLPRRGRRDSENGMPADHREIELDGTVITYASASGGVEELQEPSAISLIKPKPNTGRTRDRRPLTKTSPAHAEDRAQQGAQRDKPVMPAGDRAGESYEPVGDFALSGQTLKTGLQTPSAAVADTQKTTSKSKKTSSDIEQVSRRRKMSTGGRLLLGKASGGSARASDVAVFESADLLSLQGDAKALANATSMNRRSTRN